MSAFMLLPKYEKAMDRIRELERENERLRRSLEASDKMREIILREADKCPPLPLEGHAEWTDWIITVLKNAGMQEALPHEATTTPNAEDGRAYAARRCAAICSNLAVQANNPDSLTRDRQSAQWKAAYHMCDASVMAVRDAIKAEFPEAFPTDPNAWAFDRGLEST